ncbi:MAG: hypothetical protein KJ666_14025 [Bacteroidetes bacterium]|nr:hypothetical protein [Bacteroidota bacterium]MBU2584490.1 hypothetical protein [Bacteroidota bacterium]
MKRESRNLLAKATDSILLSIEHFNRPWDRGRHEAVLVLLDRAFELLLKSVIRHKGGRIRERYAKETIGFDSCVRKCVSDAQVKCLTEVEALTIQIINSLRDAAQHYIVEVSEQQLYIYTQSALTLFDKMLKDVFNKKLIDYLPERVLPVSSTPPSDFESLMTVELSEIKKLLAPYSRRRFEAKTKLRSFAIIEASLGGSRLQPSDGELEKLAKRISKGDSWEDIFPGIKRLTFNADDDGMSVTLRITKSKGQPIHLVPEGTPGATVVAVKRVDELSFYSLNLTALALKIGLTSPKTLAVIKELKLTSDAEYYKQFMIGKMQLKRYSPKAIDRIKKELPSLDIDEVWKHHKPTSRKKTGGA